MSPRPTHQQPTVTTSTFNQQQHQQEHHQQIFGRHQPYNPGSHTHLPAHFQSVNQTTRQLHPRFNAAQQPIFSNQHYTGNNLTSKSTRHSSHTNDTLSNPQQPKFLSSKAPNYLALSLNN